MQLAKSPTTTPPPGKWRRRLVIAGAFLYMLVLGYLLGGGLARTLASL